MKIRKTNLECALESTVSLFGILHPCRLGARGERVAQDSPLKSCSFSRFSTSLKCRKPEMRDLRYIATNLQVARQPCSKNEGGGRADWGWEGDEG